MKAPAFYDALPIGTRAAILMTISAVTYALTFVTVRALSETFSVYQLVLLRAAIGTAFMLPWLCRSGMRSLRTTRWKLYGLRAVIVYSGNLCWFYALAEMALADATALSFLMPVFTALILAFWMRERLTGPRITALFLGLAGAFVVIRPGFAEVGLATVAMLFTTIAYGAATAQTRVLAKTENTNVVVFFMFALNTPLALGPGLYHWVMPTGLDWALIAAFGLLSLYSQIFMTRALALAEAALVMPCFYLQLPLAGLFGFFLFGQVPEIWLLPGAALIIGGSYYSVWSESRRRKAAAGQAA
jgi:drug/metabolite transporter (DMT)-like permease